MTDNEVLTLIDMAFRRAGQPSPINHRDQVQMRAWWAAARQIASEAMTQQRRAARAASIAGYAVTRGRTNL